MTMNRVIHQAVRRDLQRLEAGFRELPPGDLKRAEGLRRAWDYLHSELTRHHEGEDTYVWPMLEAKGVDAGLLRDMETEHHAMADALASATSAVHQAATTASRADADAAATAIGHADKVTQEHLAHEENELEPLMIPHLESAEWKATEKQLRKASPGTAGRFFAWLQDGMTPEGRSFLSDTVPAPVTFILSRVFGRRYYREVAPVWR